MRIEEKEGSLVIVDFDGLEAYKIAVGIERDGVRFYKGLAARVAKPAARETLELLASQERDHLSFFQKQIQLLRLEREDAFEEDDLLGSLDYGIFRPYQGMEGLEKILSTPEKALRLAVIIEDRSVQFYEACLARVTSGEARRELASIVDEERRHKKLLEETRV